MESTATKVWFGQSKRATLFEGTCFKILLLIFACFLETASQLCGKVTGNLARERGVDVGDASVGEPG